MNRFARRAAAGISVMVVACGLALGVATSLPGDALAAPTPGRRTEKVRSSSRVTVSSTSATMATGMQPASRRTTVQIGSIPEQSKCPRK
jgi:hypothetical protein